MEQNTMQLIDLEEVRVAPSDMTTVDPKDFSLAEVRSAVAATRIVMISELTAIATSLATVLKTTTGLTDKLLLTDKLTSIYKDIDKFSTSLQKGLVKEVLPEVTFEKLPFLNFKTKRRSQVWREYCEHCSRYEEEQMSKSEFFACVRDLGFVERKIHGEVNFKAPRNWF